MRGGFFDGKCITQELLPGYAVGRIRTGQWGGDGGMAGGDSWGYILDMPGVDRDGLIMAGDGNSTARPVFEV